MSRMLAAKASLCTRVDSLGEDGSFELGTEHKVKLESRLRLLEEGNIRRLSGTAKAKAKFEKFYTKSEILEYPVAADSTLQTGKRRHSEIEDKKPLIEEISSTETPEKPKKKKIKSESETQVEVKQETEVTEESVETTQKKKKKKKNKQEPEEAPEEEVGVVLMETEEISEGLYFGDNKNFN